jgi:hypothetical protein
MREVYLAYFDFLGFKEFILNNDDESLIRRMGHIFRDIEIALGQGEYNEPNNGVITANFSNSKLNCLNISDTVVFWTNDTELESLRELLNVAFEFNWKENLFNFPVRGAIIKGKIRKVNGKTDTLQGGSYGISCLYGEGIVRAHLKAEGQNWAGTVIDQSILNEFSSAAEVHDFLKPYAVKYKIPYKDFENDTEEYAFRFTKGSINEAIFKSKSDSIYRVFSQDNKSIEHLSVQQKIENTVKYLKGFIE